MGLRPIPRPRGLFVKSPLGNPEKQRLTFIVWFFIVCSQGIKRPAYMSPAFDELYLLRTYPSYVFWFLMDCKIGPCSQAYTIPCAFLGVLRTFYRHRRFASCLFSMKRVSPAKASLRLQAAISLAFALKVSKDRRTCRRLLMDYTLWGYTQVISVDFDGL